ncbi:MAG: low-complexity tail membrane protein [Spirulinaceae cyanobacterium RM2_2_10]|nr:low-complexity tail membrane protein [Spirulinaceae cyanobacterium SM2_1_0]NJO20174.1 low-complexity tail membrane protein [Spirulinaceae cyanobacterium RM2_2_10]
MTAFKLEPFLWIHLAGLAALPLLLQVLWLSLAAGQPLLPVGLELAVLTVLGIGPILWMQWTRPFDIFSLLLVTLRPDRLNDDQRRILQLFKAPRQRLLAIAAAALAFWLLHQLYRWTPLVAGTTLLSSQNHLVGLVIAIPVFLACNLFLQVPLSVLGVLLHSQQQFAATVPYASDRITNDFSVLGWRVARLLPAYTLPPVAATTAGDAPTATAVETPAADDPTAAVAPVTVAEPTTAVDKTTPPDHDASSPDA